MNSFCLHTCSIITLLRDRNDIAVAFKCILVTFCLFHANNFAFKHLSWKRLVRLVRHKEVGGRKQGANQHMHHED